MVANRMMAALSGHGAYSDAPPFDGDWLGTLFRAAGMAPPVTIESIDELLHRRFDFATIGYAKEAARKSHPPIHRAAEDVRHHLEVFRLASEGI